MKTPPITVDFRHEKDLPHPNGHSRVAPVVRFSPTMRVAFVLSWIVAGLMLLASAWGLIVDDLYRDGAWGREAFRGGDAVTLLIAVPLLAVALALSTMGSARGQVLWIGMLIYAAYTYAYAVFGAVFNDAFLVHIAILSMALFALACAVPNLDRGAIAEALRSDRRARSVGAFLAIVGVLQGLLWGFLIVRNAITGELLHDIPVAGQHLVFALDLGILMPLLIVSGVLLFRRLPIGYLLGGAMAAMGAIYQLNLMIGGVYQEQADVAGVNAFPPEGILLAAMFLVAMVAILIGRREPRPGSAPVSPARPA
jgi:hypothetical protein